MFYIVCNVLILQCFYSVYNVLILHCFYIDRNVLKLQCFLNVFCINIAMFSKMFFVLILQCFQKCFLYCNVRPKMFSCRVLHVGRLSVLMDSDENNLKTISKFKFACFPAEFNSHRGKLFTLCSNILSCSNTIAKLNPFLKMLFRFFSI